MAELSYPLSEHRDDVTSASGRTVAQMTLEAAVAGELTPADIRISPATLHAQARFAEDGGNPQLAENLRRGAELATFADDELLSFYESLRPGRSTAPELQQLADALASRGAPRCAALVREACDAYVRRGLIP